MLEKFNSFIEKWMAFVRGGGDITWSRHITAHDRIIYDIYEEVVEVYILEVEGHYNDK